jgi:hypothetical protein
MRSGNILYIFIYKMKPSAALPNLVRPVFRIRDPVLFYSTDLGWSNGRIRTRDKQTKFVNSLYTKIGRIRDPVFFYPPDLGWSNGWIRDKTSRIRNTGWDYSFNRKTVWQDALDLFVGNYVVSPTEGVTHESPVIKEKMDTRSGGGFTLVDQCCGAGAAKLIMLQFLNFALSKPKDESSLRIRMMRSNSF